MFFETLEAAWPPWRVISSSISSRVYFVQRAGHDQRLAFQRPRAAGRARPTSIFTPTLFRSSIVSCAELAVQEVVNALGDDRADLVGLAQLLDAGRHQGVDRAKLLGQHRRHPAPTWRMAKAFSSRASPRFLLASMPSEQIINRLAAHPLQVQQPILPLFQPVQVAVVADQLFADQLIDQLVAQPFDVHRVAAGEVADAAP